MFRLLGLITPLIIFFSSCSVKPSQPTIDLSSYKLIDSTLHLEVIASEPAIVAPVAIDFDQKGRLWVAEMPDYMPDINGEGEQIPAGRIVILEDQNGDGIMDRSKVFLDHIHQLRAISLFKDGILYADDPNLYYTEIKNDQPHNTIIIDSTYSSGGNVEHKPNGLLKNIDNCFYSAKSNYRYCYKNDKWSKEAVFFRGQWGITQDQNGRIYTNDNSNLLFGDAFLPGLLTHNRYIKKGKGINDDIIKDRSVFPLHATSINRGYSAGVLDEQGRLKATTSACGPHIMQSSKWGPEYQGDAFICVPEGNLIKQINLSPNEFRTKGEFASINNEFLASTDEAFRPVNVSTGPDGNLYVVDFHRGIIQHKIYMTNYLKEQIEKKGLDRINQMGRILKISKVGSEHDEALNHDFTHIDSLLKYLGSENPWLRRMAHENLCFSDHQGLDNKLYSLLKKSSKLTQLHTLWILDSRNNIDLKKVNEITFSDPWVIANLFKIIAGSDSNLDPAAIISTFEKYKKSDSDIVLNHLLASSHVIYDIAPQLHEEIWKSNQASLDMAKLSAFPDGAKVSYSTDFATFNQRVENEDIYHIHKENSLNGEEDGYFLYNSYCSSCHGYGGNGIEGQAPSLVGSKLINSGVEMVPLIIMHGLKGPVTVGTELQEYASVMPAFMESADLTSRDVAKISNYVYNAFREKVKYTNVTQVDSLTKRFANRKEMWTEESLLSTE